MEENQKLEDVCKLSDVKKGELTLYYSSVYILNKNWFWVGEEIQTNKTIIYYFIL